MQEEFIEYLKCPNTNMLFHTPVLSQGIIYEDQLCNDPDKILHQGIKSFIGTLLDEFPEYKELQYVPKVMKISSASGKAALNNGINLGKYDVVFGYSEFVLNHISNEMLIKFFAGATYDQIVYFVDNLVDINEIGQTQRWKVVNYICRFSSNNIHLLTYIIEKGSSMSDFCPEDNWYPLYQILHASNDEDCIIFAMNEHIKAGLSLYVTNNTGEAVIGKICGGCGISVIQYALTVMDRDNEFVNYIDMIIERVNGNAKLNENDKECLIAELFK